MAFRVYNKTTKMFFNAVNVLFDDTSGCSMQEVNQDENLTHDQNEKVLNTDDEPQASSVEPYKLQVPKMLNLRQVVLNLIRQRML